MNKLTAAVRSKATPILFVSSSLMLTAADFCVSNLLHYVLLPGNLSVSIVAGRITGALVGFLLNRSIVFRRPNGSGMAEMLTFVKYAAVWLFNYFAALLLVSLMNRGLGLEFWLAQMAAGLLLYVPNYLLQRNFVFRKRPGAAYYATEYPLLPIQPHPKVKQTK